MHSREGTTAGLLEVGVDVGGTFTDFIGSDGTDTWVVKVPSTPLSPGQAVVEGLERLSSSAGIPVERVKVLLHGTTLATNAVLQRRGARTALITTRGFRDVLAIARQARPRLFDFDARRPEPLIPRALRVVVTERMNAAGEIEEPLDVGELRELIHQLKERVESLAICFLHAYANPAHERQARQIIHEEWPDVPVSLSSDILCEYREYERSSTTTINAFVAPAMAEYLEKMERDLRALGVRCPVRIMQSNGGLMSVDRACRIPAATVLSGVAAGALGGVRIAAAAGRLEVLTLDMGGTSCDLAVGFEGDVLSNRSYEVGGLPVRLPALDVHTIGAGGGSIAYVDSGGGVHVGPRSAGARPGPACYGLRGDKPTVTDANLILGRIPAGLLGGEVPLNRELAVEAVRRYVADPLGIEIEEAAAGIVRVINAAMAREMRVLTVQRGIDPRNFALVAFGGGGPVHAVELAQELEMKEVIIPPAPGVTSAVGLLVADTRYDRVKTVLIELAPGSGVSDKATRDLEDAFQELEAEIRDELTFDASAPDVTVVREVEMRYLRQGHELRVTASNPVDSASLEKSFHAVHRTQFGYAVEGEPMLVVNALVTLVVAAETRPIGAKEPQRRDNPISTQRKVWFDGAWENVDVIQRHHLRRGTRVSGPIIVEQTDTTTVVPPGFDVEVDHSGNLVIPVRLPAPAPVTTP